MTEQELRADIKNRDFKRFYLIFGEDTYLKHHYAAALAKAAVNDVLPDMNLSRLDGCAMSIQQLADETDQLPVMNDYRCVFVNDFNITERGENEMKDFKSIISDLPESAVLILLLDTVEINIKKPEKWGSIIKLADKVGASVNFEYKSEAALQRILIDSAARRHTTLDIASARYLIQNCGRDLQRLQGELDKLCMYKKDGQIEREDIDRLTAKTPDANRYRLPTAILERNVSGALQLVDELLDMRLSEPEIIACVIGGFVDIYRAKAAISAGIAPKELADEFGYGARRGFVLDKAAVNAKRLSTNTLNRCLELLDRADGALKTGADNKKLVLEQMVVMLIEALRSERV